MLTTHRARRARRPHAAGLPGLLRRVRLTDDGGFTLLEIVVAMVILATVLLSLIGVQLSSLQTVTLAKQRQQASALADQTMEQLRALPYDTVTSGLLSTDTAGDPNITTVSGVLTFAPTYDPSISEQLVTSSTQTAAPLVPHVQTIQVGNVPYDVRTYVSRVDPTQPLGDWLTVIVTWSSGSTHGASKSVAVRSQLFSPTGCNAASTATRPFAGPCQAFFYTDAGTAPAGITISPTTAGQNLVSGIDATNLEADLPGMSVRTQNEQIVSTQSSVTATAMHLTSSSGTATWGNETGVSAADTDPATGTGGAGTVATVVNSDGTLTSTSSAVGGFSLTAASTAAGDAFSTTTAAATPACNDDLGVAITGGQACSATDVTPSGNYQASLQLTPSDHGPLNMVLSQVNSLSSGGIWRAFGARLTAPQGTHCTTTSGIGCAASGAQRSFAAIAAGTLPSGNGSNDVVPSGFTSMVQMSGFSATAHAEAGIGVGPASTASRTITGLAYWNGTSMVSPTVGASGLSVTLGSVTGSYGTNEGSYTITVNGTLSIPPVASPATTCGTASCTVVATVPGVTITLQYTIKAPDGATLGSFTVLTSTGDTVAQANYKAAPSA